MKLLVVGRDREVFFELARARGLELVEESPDVLVAYGGDGALIGAEREFPRVPKMGIRDHATCIKCPEHQDALVLDRLVTGTLDEQELMLIEGRMNGRTLRAMNDIIIRNADARTAVRFFVSLNGRRVTEEMIGDGLVACTPFGSSAYFRSITRMVIRVGIGLAFNNCTDLFNHLVIGEDEEAMIEITRGPGTLAADNDDETIEMATGDRLIIRRSPDVARVIAIDTLRCADCRYVHAPRRRY
jgi:NAD+ kinase